jgi:hypothetical protein
MMILIRTKLLIIMDGLETSLGSSFACFETKLISQDTQGTGPSKNVSRGTTLDVEHTYMATTEF